MPHASVVLLSPRKFLLLPFLEENRSELWFVPKRSLEKLSMAPEHVSHYLQSPLSPWREGEQRAWRQCWNTAGCWAAG